MSQITTPLTRAEVETLVQVTEDGPVAAGKLVSSTVADCLILRSYAVWTTVKGEQGYLAVTPQGVNAYKAHFGTYLGGTCDTINEAKAMRLAKLSLRRMILGGK